jgi:RNA polymerase sigma factor (sigma-70 family)
MTDLELIRLYLETQETSYFSALYTKYYNRVFAKCLAILGDHAIAQDAAQEVFTKIFLNLSGFNEKAQFSTWIYSITYNYCIDVIRKEKKNQMFSHDMEKAGAVLDDVEDVFLLEMKLDRLKALLERIPLSDKAMLMMKYQDDLSIREIGEICYKSESAVKMQLKRAKQKVRQIYDELYADTY